MGQNEEEDARASGDCIPSTKQQQKLKLPIILQQHQQQQDHHTALPTKGEELLEDQQREQREEQEEEQDTLSWTSSSLTPESPSFPSSSGNYNNINNNNSNSINKMATIAPTADNMKEADGIIKKEEEDEPPPPPPPPPPLPPLPPKPPTPTKSSSSRSIRGGGSPSTSLSSPSLSSPRLTPRKIAPTTCPRSPLVPRPSELANVEEDRPFMMEEDDDDDDDNEVDRHGVRRNNINLLPGEEFLLIPTTTTTKSSVGISSIPPPTSTPPPPLPLADLVGIKSNNSSATTSEDAVLLTAMSDPSSATMMLAQLQQQAAAASDSGGAVADDGGGGDCCDRDSSLQRELLALEDKVVLEEMLHHRRLPSTIYEDPSNPQFFTIDEDEDEDDDSFFRTVPVLSTSSSGGGGETRTSAAAVTISSQPQQQQQSSNSKEEASAVPKEEKKDDDNQQQTSPQNQSQSPPRSGGGDLSPLPPLAVVAVPSSGVVDTVPTSEDVDEAPPLLSRPLLVQQSLTQTVKKSFSLENLQKLESSVKKSFSLENMQKLLNLQQPQDEEPPKPSSTKSLPTFPRRYDGSGGDNNNKDSYFAPMYTSTKLFQTISKFGLKRHYSPVAAATWVGFWALLNVSCSNHVLTPLRDAIALQVGVKHMPTLTLVSTVLAFGSSVPIGWLFEAPDPSRRRLWKRMGLTRGETQGTSLALFYRFFALTLVSYAIGFQFVQWQLEGSNNDEQHQQQHLAAAIPDNLVDWFFSVHVFKWFWQRLGTTVYVAFFLVVHLMKLHSTSLIWGVTTEAMEYEEVARRRTTPMESSKTRLQRLALVGFGGTMGGILGSILASSMAYYVRLPGLLLLAAFLLEISAELSIELGRIMQKHWEEQQLFQSSNDLASLDASMKRSVSVGSMKRVASGNSLNRVRSATDLSRASNTSTAAVSKEEEPVNDNTFMQRLMRGVTTIIRSRLLMAIFTYNALYASTNVLLSFQRAELVVNRNAGSSGSATAEADTAFLARINMASSVAIFALQASGMGAYVAHKCGSSGTLTLMPLIRLLGVLSLAWWHRTSNGAPPNLLLFLVVDECCKVMNLAIAKPVRESLWRGLSNEARYEAKPIVDTLANRWGGGSAAFLVSFISRAFDLFGVESGAHNRKIFGFPPILFLCMVIATWWTVVSADLGHIRRKIDLELKKRQ